MVDLAFLLVNEAKYPEPARVVAEAERLGIALEHQPGDESEPMSFGMANGGTFLLMLVEAPHPDAPNMAYGPTSPAREEAVAAPAHFIATGLGLEGDERARDLVMAKLASSVIANTAAVGAMLGHGVIFHKAGLFHGMTELGVEEGELPSELICDITVAPEGDDRMSFLTHGLQRYGREELYVTCSTRGKGGLDFVFSIARWLLGDMEKQLPTGDTIGRSAEEKVTVQRVPNPTGRGDQVMLLELS